MEVKEYEPALHGVHEVAPAPVPVFVIEPAAQVEQEATLEVTEYEPATHGVHEAAPTFIPVFVIEPAAQVVQVEASLAPTALLEVPTLQLTQALAAVSSVEYLPAMQSVQVPVSIVCPAPQLGLQILVAAIHKRLASHVALPQVHPTVFSAVPTVLAHAFEHVLEAALQMSPVESVHEAVPQSQAPELTVTPLTYKHASQAVFPNPILDLPPGHHLHVYCELGYVGNPVSSLYLPINV